MVSGGLVFLDDKRARRNAPDRELLMTFDAHLTFVDLADAGPRPQPGRELIERLRCSFGVDGQAAVLHQPDPPEHASLARPRAYRFARVRSGHVARH
jgi:hypothetical protein